MRERQEHGGGKNLSGLDSLQIEARIVATFSKWRVLENHRTCARDFTGNGKALYQTQRNQQCRGEPSDLLICREESHGHRGKSHQKQTQQQHVLAAMSVAPVSEE